MSEPVSEMTPDELNLLDMTAQIVASAVRGMEPIAFSSNIRVMVAATHRALLSLREPVTAPASVEVAHEPAVPIRSSVKYDYIVCLEDGKKLKTLKRYLRTQYNMSPEEYIAKWKLPRDYPMTAPAYSEQRRTLAKAMGLGTKEARGEPRLPMGLGR